jgi:hypothetical protein
MFWPASNAETLPLPSGVTTFGPNGPLVGQFNVPEGVAGVKMQLVAVSVLAGEIPLFVVATHSVEAKLMASLLGFKLKNIQFGMKNTP